MLFLSARFIHFDHGGFPNYSGYLTRWIEISRCLQEELKESNWRVDSVLCPSAAAASVGTAGWFCVMFAFGDRSVTHTVIDPDTLTESSVHGGGAEGGAMDPGALLWNATRNGDLEEARRLVEGGANVNWEDWVRALT